MNENRRFLLEDIIAMLPQSKDTQWLDTLNESELTALWNDLIEKEATK